MLYLDNVVGKLLDVEGQARRTLDEAQQYYDKTIEEIGTERREIDELYAKKARKHLEDVKASESRSAEERISSIKAQYKSRTDSLEETYQRNHSRWEDELLCRVTGGER